MTWFYNVMRKSPISISLAFTRILGPFDSRPVISGTAALPYSHKALNMPSNTLKLQLPSIQPSETTTTWAEMGIVIIPLCYPLGP